MPCPHTLLYEIVHWLPESTTEEARERISFLINDALLEFRVVLDKVRIEAFKAGMEAAEKKES